jgi:Flp pilus assembly secretin CpaC
MRIRSLVLIVLAGLALGATASPAAGDVHRMQVELKTRIVEVKRGQVRELGIKPGLLAADVTCPPGRVATSAGASSDGTGVSVLSSLATGPRTYRLELGNFSLIDVDVVLSALCVRAIDEPRLGVGTGTVRVTVPAADLSEAGLVPGTTKVTGTCTRNDIPVSSGADLGSEGVLSIAESYPSGPRKLAVIVRNYTLEERQALVAVRCLDLPDGVSATRASASPTIAAATGEGASLEPGEAEGTKRCPAGKVPVGGGYRAPENAFGHTFPTLRNGPALGYLFRNYSHEQEEGSIVIFCVPKVVRTNDEP